MSTIPSVDSIKAATAAIKAKYKYRVLGKQDLILQKLDTLLPKGSDTVFDTLKKQRIREMTTLEQTNNVDSRANAQAKLAFLKTAALKILQTASARGDLKSSVVLGGMGTLLTELDDTVNEYTSSAVGNTTALDNARFAEDVRIIAAGFRKVMIQQKAAMSKEHTLFSPVIWNAGKTLTNINHSVDLLI